MLSNVYLCIKDPHQGRDVAALLNTQKIKNALFSTPADLLVSLKNGSAPSLILLDMHTDGMDGWQLHALLRSSKLKQLNSTPIIIMSSVLPDYCLQAIMENIGAQGCLAMPATTEKLEQALSIAAKKKAVVKKPLVLLIDDDPHSSSFISKTLDRSGYSVKTAQTAEEGLDLAEQIHPGILIVDHLLPDNKSALDIMPELMKLKSNPLAVTIAITASDDTHIPFLYINAGADAFIRKPFSENFLLTTIHKAQQNRMFKTFEQAIDDKTRELRIAENNLRDLFENAPVGYHTLSHDGTILAMNQTELDWLGYKREEIIGRKIFDIQSEASAIKGLEAFEELRMTRSIKDLELRFLRADGSTFPVRIDSTAAFDGKGEMISTKSIVRNVTSQKAVEQSLARAQKMESTAILSDGIAHNFNNLLTPIMANASELLDTLELTAEDRDALQDIVEAARKGAKLVKQLAMLKRSPVDGIHTVNINQIAGETIALLNETTFQSRIFVFKPSSNNLAVKGNPDQIRQIILNLVLNARDATKSGDTITISSSESSHPHHKNHSFALITVSDKGEGIPPALQTRIFDAFFTTRGLANHSGLGLSIAYSLAADHGGFIDIESQHHKGTDALIYLPLAKSEIDKPEHKPAKQKAKRTADSIPNGKTLLHANILIVDDEEIQLKTASRILLHAGYRVTGVTSPAEAVKLLEASTVPAAARPNHPAAFDLVILDLIFDGESRENMLPEIRTACGNAPVIIVSGSTGRNIALRLYEMGAASIITKPYKKEHLLRTVAATLIEAGTAQPSELS